MVSIINVDIYGLFPFFVKITLDSYEDIIFTFIVAVKSTPCDFGIIDYVRYLCFMIPEPGK